MNDHAATEVEPASSVAVGASRVRRDLHALLVPIESSEPPPEIDEPAAPAALWFWAECAPPRCGTPPLPSAASSSRWLPAAAVAATTMLRIPRATWRR